MWFLKEFLNLDFESHSNAYMLWCFDSYQIIWREYDITQRSFHSLLIQNEELTMYDVCNIVPEIYNRYFDVSIYFLYIVM